MKNDLIYLYCVTDTLPFPGQSIESHGLESLEYNDFYFIVRYVPPSEFSEENINRNLSDMRWLEIMAAEHMKVVNKVKEYNSVIPFEFGTIFNSEENLKKFAAGHSRSLTANFIKVNGKAVKNCK
jgi:hypothetical protein